MTLLTAAHVGSNAAAVTDDNLPDIWKGDLAGEFREPFLDAYHIDDLTGVTMSVNKPTKYGSNPLLETGTNNATWDYQKPYVSVIFDGTTWHAFYNAAEFDSPNADRGAYATSDDGLTFTKGNLGNITYDGSTNNNLIIDAQLVSVNYHADLGLWVGMVAKSAGSVVGVYIYTSTSPNTGWTLVKTLTVSGTSEGHDLLRREDGRWLAYYVDGQNVDTRTVFAQLSDTIDIDGSYTNLGEILPDISASDQRYSLGVHRIGELHYGFGMGYHEANGQTWLNLNLSRNGRSFGLIDTEWIPVGGAGAWDDQLIFNGSRITEEGNNWHVYYCGSPVTHDTPRPKDMRVGRATIGKGRIGQVSGTGTVTTGIIRPTTGQSLSINCDASGGTVEVEVLDADGVTITGYSQADATDITTDTFAIEPTWTGPVTMPVNQDIKLRFHLTAATLHGYEIT